MKLAQVLLILLVAFAGFAQASSLCCWDNEPVAEHNCHDEPVPQIEHQCDCDACVFSASMTDSKQLSLTGPAMLVWHSPAYLSQPLTLYLRPPISLS